MKFLQNQDRSDRAMIIRFATAILVIPLIFLLLLLQLFVAIVAPLFTKQLFTKRQQRVMR